eukprot:TRINITY_DN18468_c3_g1_i1.p1 TRINITY_DN18468_c3_g1~~TRINITY_DN18468_c3_g1_i1.p1  ORF type:complete len:114 (-),score=14.74 TRINITY_DN18468_c3_g1_i1:13-354(-)
MGALVLFSSHRKCAGGSRGLNSGRCESSHCWQHSDAFTSPIGNRCAWMLAAGLAEFMADGPAEILATWLVVKVGWRQLVAAATARIRGKDRWCCAPDQVYRTEVLLIGDRRVK